MLQLQDEIFTRNEKTFVLQKDTCLPFSFIITSHFYIHFQLTLFKMCLEGARVWRRRVKNEYYEMAKVHFGVFCLFSIIGRARANSITHFRAESPPGDLES